MPKEFLSESFDCPVAPDIDWFEVAQGIQRDYAAHPAKSVADLSATAIAQIEADRLDTQDEEMGPYCSHCQQHGCICDTQYEEWRDKQVRAE